jgi:hypothetical protein
MNNFSNHKLVLRQAQINAANYFFWIAALSVVNTVLILSNAKFTFAFSLGIVDLVSYGSPDKTIAIVFTAVMAAIFAGLGLAARTGNAAVFITGMTLYALDAILLIFLQDWIGIAVHAYILFRLFQGVKYSFAMKKIVQQEEAEMRRQRIEAARSGQQ